MAAKSGATPRELLHACIALQRAGTLQPIRVRWGGAMKREHWRFAFEPLSTSGQLAAALARLPGCVRIERSTVDAGPPRVWAEIQALDAESLQRQLARLPQPPCARVRLPGVMTDTTSACDDPLLAALIEQGLPLCSRPFAHCARQLHCSEHRVISTLQGWRRAGQLECLTLKPTPTCGSQPGVIALWHKLPPAPELISRLGQQPNVDRVVSGVGEKSWPWELSIVLRTTPQLMNERVKQLLEAVGLSDPPDDCIGLRIEQPRDEAWLFCDAAPQAEAPSARRPA